MEINLLYLPDCRNVGQARANLRDACDQVGIAPQWLEVDLSAPGTPAEYRDYGSPTILVNGRDIVPDPQPGGV